MNKTTLILHEIQDKKFDGTKKRNISSFANTTEKIYTKHTTELTIDSHEALRTYIAYYDHTCVSYHNTTHACTNRWADAPASDLR